MIRVKSLIKRANPVPDTTADGMPARASDELASLVGSGPALPLPSRRSPRRRLLLAAAVCGAAAVVAGVAVLTLQGPEEPGGGRLVADEPYYGSTAQLEGAADLIVRARLGAGREESADDYSETVAAADVLAIAKGEAPGRSIELAYTTPGSGPETAALTEGKEYVFLLERQDDGRFTLVNSTQGSYGIEGGRARAGADNDVALSEKARTALRLER
ncbi:hypothetical protein OG883_29720 [Streptomyces sp. NBC_01142]|uniref:hypothetical protein n=1 Tax=Streptomyces sp. NBC_01142 TaxID=2975865 RepID=UPI0022582FFC|nr:hypothetical protein [Streptomyces sp. NBC_01142]MCX4823981.1 hypothetical protein [Streptomyces sp. NBC_01142]